MSPIKINTIPINGPLLRGERKPRVALIGRIGAGKSSLFERVASPLVEQQILPGIDGEYRESIVDVGLDQISLLDFPSINFFHHPDDQDEKILSYLLWGDKKPNLSRTDENSSQCRLELSPPDVLVQVIDAMSLERDLELSLELSLFGRPLVIALNRVDLARKKGQFINVQLLSEQLGVPVIPTVAHMGKGVPELFQTVLEVVRKNTCPVPQSPTAYIDESLTPLKTIIAKTNFDDLFKVPRSLLLSRLAEKNPFFIELIKTHSPALQDEIHLASLEAGEKLPRPLEEEIHADRHHRAASLFETITTPRAANSKEGWRFWLDRFFLHPKCGVIGSLLVFVMVLFIVFKMSTFIDSWTAVKLAEWVQEWQPTSTSEVVARAVADGLVGLVAIVVPYMLPLVLLLVMLEESGVMHRVAFVVDRGFHRVGLHGDVALPFLIGLGCNVPAISVAAATGSRRERIVSSILITLVPCSARSAILLAIGGKYLGGLGVFAIFMLTLIVIALLGKLLMRRYTDNAPGMIQMIPPYAKPAWKSVWKKTWERTSDILTIVTPLLIAGSIVLALLEHYGADRLINTLLTPITSWWLGLPIVLGVPILFGVLRKELSLLMIYQALGTQEIVPLLSQTQIFTFLIFMTFYVPCLSTFAVMLKTLGWKESCFSVFVSLTTALILAGAARSLLGLVQLII